MLSKMQIAKSTALLIYVTSLLSCNLEKEVDLVLPEYDPQMVVECYLEPGQPFQLLLTKSFAFFDPINLSANFLNQVLEDSAQVLIRFGQEEVWLSNTLAVSPGLNKVFNYTSNQIVPPLYDQPFDLDIVLKDGRTIQSRTVILPQVPIDSLRTEFEPMNTPRDPQARVLLYFTDPDLSQKNYFRRQLHHNSVTDSLPDQDFLATDQFSDNGLIAFGSGYSYAQGDTVFNTIFHLTFDHFEFLKTVFTAAQSNGNPFGQPSTLTSNVSGTANPIGIFTGLSYTRDTLIIKK